jgi:hypothetical protein
MGGSQPSGLAPEGATTAANSRPHAEASHVAECRRMDRFIKRGIIKHSIVVGDARGSAWSVDPAQHYRFVEASGL